jgi:hypothetical protein
VRFTAQSGLRGEIAAGFAIKLARDGKPHTALYALNSTIGQGRERKACL